jgi:hypothetical protein
MVWGRQMGNQRKIAEIWGFSIFRMVVKFALITAAFLGLDQNMARACIIVLIALDLALQANTSMIEAVAIDTRDKAWFDTLTNRIFYKEFFEKVRSGEHVDVDRLFEISSKAAVADIGQAQKDAGFMLELSGFSKFGYGVWSFISNVFAYAFGYGAPYFVSTILHH